MCSDLVAGTHGRGFWILDDVTPLRQVAEAAAASNAYLFKPATGIRVRFGTNDPTPWPPELPAGENPPPGALIDYYLPAAANGEVKLEFLNTQGKVIRTYSSNALVRSPDPATDPVAYNKLCQQTPTAPDCNLPLYWPAPPQALKATAGMHRFSWDMHYDPIGGGGGGGRGGGGGGAVPHRTYPGVNSPWVAPGAYTVRLTVNGQSQSQPIAIKMDPRVKITPEVQRIFTLTTQMENNARNAASAYKDARALADKLKAKPQSAANDALIKQVDEIAPVEVAAAGGGGGGGGRGGRGGRGAAADLAGRAAAFAAAAAGAAPEPPAENLSTIGAGMVAAVQAMQGSEMPPTAAELKTCTDEATAYTNLMAKWAALKAKVNGPATPAAGRGAAKQ
jgi:hypothetical protein